MIDQTQESFRFVRSGRSGGSSRKRPSTWKIRVDGYKWCMIYSYLLSGITWFRTARNLRTVGKQPRFVAQKSNRGRWGPSFIV